MDRADAFFINREGKKISIENLSSHIGLALEIIAKNKQLQKEFNESGEKDPVQFLIANKGYVKITDIRFYKRCIYSSLKLSEIQREFVNYYEEHGYVLEDIDKFKMMGIGRE